MPTTTKRKPCPGHGRHWFVIHGVIGLRTPVCVLRRPQPEAVEAGGVVELEGFMGRNWRVRVGKRVEDAVKAHREETA
jgi:hypothetical protein